MLRAEIKSCLYFEYLKIFDSISNNSKLKGAKSFLRVTRRSILRDYKKGLRQINKKVPVFVELGKVKKVDEGMIKEVFPEAKKEKQNEVIEVHTVETKNLFPPKNTKNN